MEEASLKTASGPHPPAVDRRRREARILNLLVPVLDVHLPERNPCPIQVHGRATAGNFCHTQPPSFLDDHVL